MSLSIVKEMEELLEEASGVLPQEVLKNLREQFNERRHQNKVKLLLYGPYNSGKTTLINALVGEELFTMGPIPETDKLQSKSFGEYEIVDSPGFNAPTPEAEKLSEQAAKKEADVILMVSDTETMEEDKFWSWVKAFAERNKYIGIILNAKGEIEDRVRDRLSNRISVIVQEMLDKGLSPKIEGPFVVNAKSALKARMSNPVKEKLEARSGIIVLEDWIQKTAHKLGKLSGMDAFGRDFLNTLQEVQRTWESKLGSDTKYLTNTLKEIDESLKEVFNQLDNYSKARESSLKALVHKQVWSDTFDGAEFTDTVLNEIMTMSEKSIFWLEERLMDVYQHHEAEDSLLFEDLKHKLKELDVEFNPADIQSQSIVEREASEEIEGYNDTQPKVPLYSATKQIVREMEEKGILTKIERKGAKNILEKWGLKKVRWSKKLYRGLPNVIRVLPAIMLAIDVIRNSKKQKQYIEEQKERVRRQLEEQERRIEEQRETMALTIGYKVNQSFEYAKTSIKRYILSYIGKIKGEIGDKISTTSHEEEQLKEKIEAISELYTKVGRLIIT